MALVRVENSWLRCAQTVLSSAATYERVNVEISRYLLRMLELHEDILFSGAHFEEWHATWEVLWRTLLFASPEPAKRPHRLLNFHLSHGPPLGLRPRRDAGFSSIAQVDRALCDSGEFVRLGVAERSECIKPDLDYALHTSFVLLLGGHLPGFDILIADRQDINGTAQWVLLCADQVRESARHHYCDVYRVGRHACERARAARAVRVGGQAAWRESLTAGSLLRQG